MIMFAFVAVFLFGLIMGWFLRGAPTKLHDLLNVLDEERVRTKIEAEKNAQDRMLDERISG